MIGRLLRYVLALGSVCLVTITMYKFGVDIKGQRRVLPGAYLAATLWLGLTMAFTWYVRNVANYARFYGPVGAIIAFLAWMYLLALAALIGCEFNAALDQQEARKGS
jgi:membrane protein